MHVHSNGKIAAVGIYFGLVPWHHGAGSDAAPAAPPTSTAPSIAAPSSTAPSSSTAPTESVQKPAVTPEVENLKASVLNLNRDLLILEEELLYPASNQVAIYLSMDLGPVF